MFDLHTHSIFSDGVLIPAELARRARTAGYRGIAITDHVDASTMGMVIDGLKKMTRQYGPLMDLDILLGVEVTHVPPGLIPDMIQEARALGAQLVVVHGETIVEPVATGTNLAAIEGGCDVLAHPGLITPQEAALAAERGVHLEITTRKGHSLTNGHVAVLARETGAMLVIDNDAHEPGDLVSREMRKKIALGAGLSLEEYRRAEENSARLAQVARAR
ncbi:PHP family phosphohydrolase, histidinol phosphatase [Desulfocurvibacter africanus PCS]|uniref:PHP family phosphohydrolase, histidinol phosphatase n=1 Tax=Desulfocurvibacter africanus PCS TaxID=1262666 RepID=M5PV97_DESAF|nr:histidinol phosphate phosphatase domain-containing protein [Desulfocurvibacter africanus]EMG37974.1 PHP family phosphohydrolase, histidinol phosphatase [Desulfocurvibacter africanus PCS]